MHSVQRCSIHRGATLVAPLFFLCTLLLAGCVSNVREAAGFSRDVLTVMTEATGSAPAGNPGASEAAALQPAPKAAAPSTVASAANLPVTLIPLAAELNTSDAELSSLAWYGDQLILLPQYPSIFGDTIFALDKAQIGAFLRGESAGPLTPTPIAFDDGALSVLIDGFEGYEALTFAGDRAYLTIETRASFGMLGILVSGTMELGGTLLSLDPFNQASIPAQAALANMTDESIIQVGDRLITLYEANGASVNPQPAAHVFDGSLTPLGTVPMAVLEYRTTDATDVDGQGRFWVINYMWPGDEEKLAPASDSTDLRRVERLVELQLTEQGVALADSVPLELRMLPGGISRNWEGVARFQEGELNGFLLVTDKFPTTMLGFVPLPDAAP